MTVVHSYLPDALYYADRIRHPFYQGHTKVRRMLFWVKMSISEGIYCCAKCQSAKRCSSLECANVMHFWFVAELFATKVPETAPFRYAAFTVVAPKNYVRTTTSQTLTNNMFFNRVFAEAARKSNFVTDSLHCFPP